MRVLGTRSGLITVIVTGIVAMGLVAAFLVVEWTTRPVVDPLQPVAGGYVNPSKEPIVVGTTSGAMGDLKVTLDGTDVTGNVSGAGDGIVINAPNLADGVHRMAVSYSASNLFSRGASAEWQFTVDTKAPALKVNVPVGNGVNTRQVRFAGTTQPGSTVRATWKGGAVATQATADGAWDMTGRLPEGRTKITFTATDPAGNVTRKGRALVVDTTVPTLKLNGVNKLIKLATTADPVIYGRVGGDQPRDLLFGAKINGQQIPVLKGSDAVGGKVATSDQKAAGNDSRGPTLTLNGRQFALAPGKLAEGKNEIVVWVRDPGGNVARQEFTSFVDTSSEFGASQLMQGAVGADVRQLQERLGQAGVWKGGSTGKYDAKTIKAVQKYQRKHKLKVNGKVDARTLRALVGKVQVSLSKRTLTLYRDGKKVKTYRVAIGQPEYPTPTGTYKIITKEKNPTWNPPDSPWAEGLGKIPPGPGNPLGTRWIGTSAPAIGIHGTYADSSIGTAASHGCLRMHIPEVEELYEDVAVGMPVEIKP
ncbi:MAG: L,D-transpeptidase family protein [Actinomycetota bacterium]|nr:L,D-transpeptidase family protein [Actinomycetota bacterium]